MHYQSLNFLQKKKKIIILVFYWAFLITSASGRANNMINW